MHHAVSIDKTGNPNADADKFAYAPADGTGKLESDFFKTLEDRLARVERGASGLRHECTGAIDGDAKDLRSTDVEPKCERHEEER